MKRTILGAALMAAAMNTAFAGDLSYSYIEAGVADIDVDGVDLSGVGMAISGALNDTVYLSLGYAEAETDDKFTAFGVTDEFTFSQLTLGLGFHTPLAENTDLVGELNIGRAEVEFGGGEVEETARGFSLGLRSRLNQHIELSGGANYVDIDDESETTLGASVRAYIVKDLSVALGYSSGDDTDTTSLSLRFDL